MTSSRLRQYLASPVLAGIALVSSVAARAQTPPSSDQDRSPTAAPVATGPTLGHDQTSIGGPPLSDASPRLPRVDYDAPDITVPQEARSTALRGQTVLGRSRPDYDPAGLRLGSFQLFPELSARVGYDSNVFNQRNGSDDVFVRFRAGARALSAWSRDEVELDGFVDDRTYASHSSEDGVTYNVHAGGRLDITRDSSLNAGIQRSRVFIERGSTTEVLNTREPVRYNLTAATLGGRTQAGRLSLALNGLVSRYDYDNAETPDGVFLSQQFRDSNLYRGEADVGYALDAGPELFASLAVDVRRFRFAAIPDRDSTGYELLGGVRGDITPLLRGKLGIGYLHYNFRDRAVSNRNGLALDISLDYLLSDLTTISATGRRELRNASSATAPTALTTTLFLGVTHELLRNVILSAGADYEKSNYVASPLSVRRYGGDFGGQYLLNRLLRLDANVAFRRRDELHASGRDVSEAVATFGVTAHF